MGSILRALRERNSLSVVDAASRIGVTRAAIYAWENEQKEPDKLSLRSICEAYGATEAERAELAQLRAFGTDTAELPPAA